MGKKISLDYAGRVPLLVGALKGVMCLMADLVRCITIPVHLDFMGISSYGASTDSGAVRHGAERAEVTASFAVAGNAPALAWLDEQQVAHDGEVVLRRSVGADGRSRAYVNGQAMAAQALRALGELLVDVHGQLEFQSLARRSYQRDLVDESGGLQADCAAMRAAFRRWRELDLARQDFEQRGRDREARLDLLEHYVAELDALDPKADEPRHLSEERRRMAALGRLVEGTSQDRISRSKRNQEVLIRIFTGVARRFRGKGKICTGNINPSAGLSNEGMVIYHLPPVPLNFLPGFA